MANIKSIPLTLLFCFFAGSFAIGQKITIQYFFDENCRNYDVLFLHGSNNDTVYHSNQKSNSFIFNRPSKKPDILILVINGQFGDYKYISLDVDTLTFKIENSKYKGHYRLQFDKNTSNEKYHSESDKLLPLKVKSDSLVTLSYDTSLTKNDLKLIGKIKGQIRDSINKIWAGFFIEHGNSYFALNFISSNLPPSNVDRVLLTKIFTNLDSSYYGLSLYNVVRRKILDTTAQIIAGERIPDFQIKDKAGVSYSLLQIVKKSRKTYIIFWASWCYGCYLQFDEIERHYSELSDKNIQLVFVSMDADKRNAFGTIDKYGFLSDSFFLESGFDDINIYRLRIDFIPYIFSVNNEGIITKMAVKFDELFK